MVSEERLGEGGRGGEGRRVLAALVFVFFDQPWAFGALYRMYEYPRLYAVQ